MPALWPSSGAADSQAPRWAAASLSTSAADACGITAKDAATIAALVRTIFPFFVAFIATPVLRANIASLIRDGVRWIRDRVGLRRQALSADGVVDWASGSCNCIQCYRPIRGDARHMDAPPGRGPLLHSAPEQEY